MEGLTNLYKALQSLICIFSWPRGQGSRGKGNARARENLHCAIYQSPEANGGEGGEPEAQGTGPRDPGHNGGEARGPRSREFVLSNLSELRAQRPKGEEGQGPGAGPCPEPRRPAQGHGAQGPEPCRGARPRPSPEPRAQGPGPGSPSRESAARPPGLVLTGHPSKNTKAFSKKTMCFFALVFLQHFEFLKKHPQKSTRTGQKSSKTCCFSSSPKTVEK